MCSISAKRVRELLKDSFFQEDKLEDIKSGKIPVIRTEGIAHIFVFDPEKIEAHEPEIHEMLMNLPEGFREDHQDKSRSFIEMPMTKEGDQWGEQVNAEELMCLGMAAGWMVPLLPRNLWPVLPGGVPMLAIYAERHPQTPQPLDPAAFK